MPPAKDQAKVSLPSPQRKISHVFTTMPRFSGSYQRTSIKHRLLLAIIYIATLTAATIFPWTLGDPQMAGIPYHIINSKIIDSEITMQPAATVWLSEDKERLLETVLHQLPVHGPEPAIAHTIWRPRDCSPKVETTPRPYGIMPTKQYPCTHQAGIHSTEAATEPLQDLTQSPVQRLSSS
jgi:hypothetical protein